MKVLVVTPTYGRLPFLGRMVASFLSQTHENSDLVIINDDPNVNIKFDHERVFILNINKKLILDVKKNIGAVMGKDYDLIMPLDDDDIFFPEQISYHVRKFQENPHIQMYRNIRSYIVYGGKFEEGVNAPNAIAYTPDLYFDIKGYQHFSKNSGGDSVFYGKISNDKKIAIKDEENIHFVYNFGAINYHLSCIGDESKLPAIAEQQLKSLNCGGIFEIKPDYEEFQKFINMRDLFIERGKTPISVKSLSEGKIIFDI